MMIKDEGHYDQPWRISRMIMIVIDDTIHHLRNKKKVSKNKEEEQSQPNFNDQ